MWSGVDLVGVPGCVGLNVSERIWTGWVCNCVDFGVCALKCINWWMVKGVNFVDV